MKGVRKLWLQAAKILGKDPKATVKCPECGEGILVVRDEILTNWAGKVDRYMICNKCGKYNILTIDISQSNLEQNDGSSTNTHLN